MFVNEGRVMCLWKNEPISWDKKPCWVALTRYVHNVFLTEDKKTWTVEVVLSDDMDEVLEFSTDNIEDNQKWVDSINFFNSYWASKPTEIYEENGSHELSTIKPELMLEIMEEIEKKFKVQYDKDTNYEK